MIQYIMDFTPLSVLITLALVALSILSLTFYWAIIRALLPKPKVSDFGKKHVLITGCDTGFGREAAISLDRLGFHVIATCLTNEGKENLQDTCSGRLIGMIMDVTDSRQIQDVYQQVRDLLPSEKGLWAVVNNAGYLLLAPLEWVKMEDLKKSADINLWGMIEVTKTFLPLVKKAKGRIVNMSSQSGLVTIVNTAPYTITKYGVEAFSDALRREMVRWDVKVCIIEPQGFRTSMWNDVSGQRLERIWRGTSQEIKREYGSDYVTKLRKEIDDHIKKEASPDIYLVTDDVIDAVTSLDPSPRYHCGWYAKYMAFLAILPTSLQDFAVRNS